MKIGILGAPGSGKTKLAAELELALRGSIGPFLILDEYIEELRDVTGQEYGLMGNHIDDMQVVFKRREIEFDARFLTTITCGTVLDSTAHCFARSEDPARNPRELTLTQARLRTIAETFGLLYTDTWDYDYAFYLPYEGEDPGNRLIDNVLKTLLFTYAPLVFSFKPEVSDDKKATIAASAITTFEAEQLSEALGQGVQSGSEDGQDDRDSSESVSDVPEQRRDSDNA